MKKRYSDDHLFRDHSGNYARKVWDKIKLSVIILVVLLLLAVLSGKAVDRQVPANEAALRRQIMTEMKAYGIPCLDAGIAKSGCAWVFVMDNGKNRGGLATTLCSTVNRYGVGFVTIMDSKANALGRARCQ
jgi:heme exporter protein D